MTIIARVCAEFHHPKTGEKIFAVTPANRLSILTAPDEIQLDPLYELLREEGSLEAVVSADQKMRLEGNPMAGFDPSGKRLPVVDDLAPTPTAFSVPAVSTAPAKSNGKKSGSSKSAKTETAEAKPAPAVVSVTTDDADETAQAVPDAVVSEQ